FAAALRVMGDPGDQNAREKSGSNRSAEALGPSRQDQLNVAAPPSSAPARHRCDRKKPGRSGSSSVRCAEAPSRGQSRPRRIPSSPNRVNQASTADAARASNDPAGAVAHGFAPAGRPAATSPAAPWPNPLTISNSIHVTPNLAPPCNSGKIKILRLLSRRRSRNVTKGSARRDFRVTFEAILNVSCEIALVYE